MERCVTPTAICRQPGLTSTGSRLRQPTADGPQVRVARRLPGAAMNGYEEARILLDSSKRTLVFTGARMSSESGMSTFRGTGGPLERLFRPGALIDRGVANKPRHGLGVVRQAFRCPERCRSPSRIQRPPALSEPEGPVARGHAEC
ncbi:MAG: hypothetical protein MZU79_01795 [Anaerotruncus sp.]|nr:hypothetical protein [Anaerotruncus sp.]